MSNIIQKNVDEIMPESSITYAEEVIKNRALPDVRDGLKPVHRRIAYSMYELKLLPNKPYRKCARIVGDVLGKYHPHGDTAVYDALVRLAQDFSIRYTLIDGHGNFGSVDGDGAAAMRYTEAKMQPLTLKLLEDINKNTVDFIPNFDGEEKEPTVLPSRFPNLLVNGSSGIAVGMATNIPPHNLNEVIDGVIYQLKNPGCTTLELMEFVKAPDFPTGGIIVNQNDIEKIYTDGHGKIIVRGKHHIEYIKDKNKEKECVVFTEIPYMVNKAKLIESIDDVSTDHVIEEKGKKIKIKAKIEQIDDVRDESDKDGMRIVIELKRKGDSEKVLNLLYKYTKLQDNFNVNNVAIVNGMPKENISLTEMIYYYIDYQKEIVTRKTKFDKEKCERDLHLQSGLTKALDKLDLTIQLIRESISKDEAKQRLQQVLDIDELQAQVILDMKLQRLTGLEKDSIILKSEELKETLKYLTNVLSDDNLLIDIIINDLTEIKGKFGDKRRTEITNAETIINNDLLIEDYNTVIQLTNDGYIKKLRATSVKSTNKDRLKENDFIIKEIKGTNKDTLLLFSNLGNVYKIKTTDLKELKPGELGELITNYHELQYNEKIIYIISTLFNDNEYMISVFDNGRIAKIKIDAFNMTVKTFKYNNKNLINITNISKDCDVLLLSTEGKAVIINTSNFNPKQSRNVNGDAGMKLPTIEELNENRIVKSFINVPEDLNFKITTEKGKVKEFYLDDVAPTGNENEQRSAYEYFKGNGNRNRGGNFVINTRPTNDKVISVCELK